MKKPAPALRILSPHPARRAALQAIWPMRAQADADEADLCLIDGTDAPMDATAWPLVPCLVLAPTRPDGLPPQARWLASPARAETLALALGQLWRERPRRLGPALLHLDPPALRMEGYAPLALTEKEAQLLDALLDAPEGLSRGELLAQWWGMSEELDTHALETHLYRLRQKLKPLLGEGLELGLQKGRCHLRGYGAV